MCLTTPRKRAAAYRQVRPRRLAQPGRQVYRETLSKKRTRKFRTNRLRWCLAKTNAEIIDVMRDLRRHGVTMLTLGQYLQPSRHHPPVQRYVSPKSLTMKAEALAMGFTHATCNSF